MAVPLLHCRRSSCLTPPTLTARLPCPSPLSQPHSDYDLDGAVGVGSAGGLALARHLLQGDADDGAVLARLAAAVQVRWPGGWRACVAARSWRLEAGAADRCGSPPWPCRV